MKKHFMLLSAMAAAVIGILAVSCQKDPDYNEKVAKTISQWEKEGIEVDMQSHVIEMDVNETGEWIAVSEAKDKWLLVNDNVLTYQGPHHVLVCIDENRTEIDRKSTIYIEDSKGEIHQIPVRQNYNFNGEAPTNGNGLAFSNNGVGFGVDYDYVLDTRGIAKRNALEDAKIANGSMQESERTKFAPTKVKKNNPIFNIQRIERLMETSDGNGGTKLGAQTYVETEIPYVDLYAKLMDSTVCQAKHLDVSLELGVSFGCIEFVAGATYDSDANEERQKMDYTVIRNSPIYNVTISEAEVANYAEDTMYWEVEDEKSFQKKLDAIETKIARYERINKSGGLTAAQQAIIDGMYAKLDAPKFDGVFSGSFAAMYWELYVAVAEQDEEKIEEAMNKIDDYVGPFYISGGDFGGAMTIHAIIDNLSMEGYVEAGGNLDADIAGAFKVTGKFNYSERGMTLMRNADARFYIYGGDANKVSDMMTGIMFSENPTDRDAWTEAIAYWINSMYGRKNSNGQYRDDDFPSENDHVDLSMAAPISFIITPVWNLFWDSKMQKTAKEWFLKKYESRGINEYFGIMNGNDIGAEKIIENAQKDA